MNQRGIRGTPSPLLDYAPRALRPRHSFYSCLAIAMADVTVLWLSYLQFLRPAHDLWADPLWWALLKNYPWPGGIGIALAILGLLQTGRKRTLSIVAVVVIVLAYAVMMPALNFA